MKSIILYEWIGGFSFYIKRKGVDRKVLVLLDNCSAHGMTESIPMLDNVWILFLKPSKTNIFQHMDAGIIAAVNTRYHKIKYERAVAFHEVSFEYIYKVDHLTAMYDIHRVWN